MGDSPRGMHLRAGSSSMIGAETSSAEDYLARFLTTKLSWKGKYERIFALTSTRFCTLDPKDFDLTNTWSYAAFVGLDLDATDDQVFTIAFNGPKKEEQLKLRYKYRSYLVSEFLRLHAAFCTGSPVPGAAPAPAVASIACTKLTRHDTEINCVLDVAVDAVVFKQPLASSSSTSAIPVPLGRYAYTDLDHVTTLAHSTTGFVLGYGGKDKIFFSSDRRAVLGHIEKAAARVGVRLTSRGALTVESVKENRRRFVDDGGEVMGEFSVQKYSPRYEAPVRRVLRVHTKVVIEMDGTEVVSRTPLKQLFGLVRNGASKSRFEVELVNGQRRLYASRDRDALLASLVDAYGVLAEANDVLSIAPTPSHSGLRLLPRFATEDPTETRTFFGDASIGSMFLKRLAAVGKYTAGTGHRAGVAAGRGLVSIACELNANVPLTGIQYYSKRSIIADALKPLSFQLRTVATCTPPALKMAVALLQCFCRIATSYYGFLDMLGLPHFVENMVHFLQADDALTVYWASLLLQRLSMHKGAGASAIGDDGMEPMARGSSADAEIANKRLIFENAKLLHALLAPLQLRPNGQLASPLMHLGVLGALEPALCSRRATTDPKDVQVLVTAMVPFYDTLIRLLFRSYCAATVEACTLLVQTVLELCPIDVASSIKDAALREGLVLQHLYQAIFDAAFDQRVVSRYLISMWMSHHPPAKKLLSRLLPPGLVSCLEMRLLSPAESYQLDELEKASFEHHKVSFFNADLSPTQSASLASRPDDADDDEDSFVASMRRPNAASDHALFEDDVADTIVLPSSLPASTRSEQLFPTRSEGARSNVPDVALPRLVGKLHSEPRESPNVYQDPTPRRAHRPASGVGMHLSLLKRAFVTRRPSNVPSDAAVIKPQENFRILFHMLQQDHDTVDLLWTPTTRDELRAALVREIQVFRDHQAHEARAVWNYEEFRVTYHSLAAALMVDGLHLRRLVASHETDNDEDDDDDDEDTWQPPLHMEDMLLKQPQRFVSALYKRFLREYPYAEFRGQLATTTTLLHVLARVTWLYEGQYNLCADDVHHLLTLLTETRRKDILLVGLRALRAITKCPAHAAKLLSNDTAIPWLVQLVQMAHVAQRIEEDDDALAAWCVHLGDAPCTGPLTVAGLAAAIAGVDVKTCLFHVHDDGVGNCVGRCQPLDAIPQLRWELGLDATIATSAVAVAHDAIHIVCDLLHANPLLMGHTKVFPAPAATRQTHDHLAGLVPLLAQYERPGLAEHVGHILVTLFDGQLPSHDVYLSGVFYLLFCYNGSAFADFGRFLQLAFAKQVRPDGTPRAILPELLPAAMLSHLGRLSKHQVADLFCTTDIATPKVIWNVRMRATLRDACIAHVADFKRRLTQQIAATYSYAPMAPVRYADLDDEVYCFGFYLDQFVRAIDSGDVVPLDDASAFLRQLAVAWRDEVDRAGASMTSEEAADVLGLASPTADLRAIRAAYKAKATATCPEYALDDRGQFDDVQEAFQVLTSPRPSLLTPGYDAVRLRLLLQTQVRLCRVYATQLYNGSAFDMFGLLLGFLEEHCTASARVPSLTTADQHDALVRLAAELLLESCIVLPAANGAALLAEAKRDVLEEVLSHCVDHVCVGDAESSLYAEVASHVVQTIAMLSTTPAGRDWVLTSESLLHDLWRLLWLFQQRLDDPTSGYLYRSVRYALEAVLAMTEARALQDKLVASTGILWHLLQLLFAYDPSLDVSTSQIVVQKTILFDRHAPPSSIVEVVAEAKNVLSDLALGVLARLCGIFQDAPAHMAALELCSALLTPNSIAFLRKQKNRHAFFSMFHGDTTSPHLIWTSALRTELRAYLAPIVGDIVSVPSRDDGVRFRFAALATHCVVATVYVAPLLDVLSSATETPSVDLVRSLALPEAFYIALFNFVETGKRDLPASVGYDLDASAMLSYREVALRILGLLAPLAPALVEVGCLRSNSGLSTVMSFVLPPTHSLFASSALDVGFAHVLVPLEIFDRFRESTLRLLHVLGGSETIGNALFQADLVVLLLHAILVEDDVSAEMLRVLYRLVTAAPSIARFVVESIWMYHLLLWLFPDPSSVTDHDFGKIMQVPAADVVTALAAPKSVVSEEAMSVCIRFVPVTLMYEIMSAPLNVERIVQGKYESPDLVWNDTMRAHLRRGLHHLALLVHQSKAGDVNDELLALEIDYAEVYSYPVVGDVYLLLYLENPIYPLRDPKFFLECLAEDYEKIVGHLLDAPSDAARSSFNPDLVMLRRQQAQVLPLLTSCIICVLRVFPVLLETLVSLKLHEKACGLFVSYQSHHKESRDDEILVCEQSLLRLFRVLFTSPKVVSALAYSPYNILSRLFAHVYLRRQGEYHAEAGFLLECVRRFVRNFPDNGDRNSDRNVVSIVCSFNLLESLLELIEHPMTLQRVLNPILTRATVVAILVDLEKHKTQGNVAHSILKKNKKWDKVYRHEPTDAVWTQPEDKFLTGPAASADAMIRQYLAHKTPSVSTNTGPVPPAPSSGKRKLNVKGFFGH